MNDSSATVPDSSYPVNLPDLDVQKFITQVMEKSDLDDPEQKSKVEAILREAFQGIPVMPQTDSPDAIIQKLKGFRKLFDDAYDTRGSPVRGKSGIDNVFVAQIAYIDKFMRRGDFSSITLSPLVEKTIEILYNSVSRQYQPEPARDTPLKKLLDSPAAGVVQYLSLQPLIEAGVENAHAIHESLGLGSSAPVDKGRVQGFVSNYFRDVGLEQVPVRAKPDILIEGIYAFDACFDGIVKKMGLTRNSRGEQEGLLQQQIDRLKEFVRSGNYQELEIPKAIDESIKLITFRAYTHLLVKDAAGRPPQDC